MAERELWRSKGGGPCSDSGSSWKDGSEPPPQGAARRRPGQVKESVFPWAPLPLRGWGTSSPNVLCSWTQLKVEATLMMSQTYVSNFVLAVAELTVLFLERTSALLTIQTNWSGTNKKKSDEHWFMEENWRGKNEGKPLHSLHIHVLIHCCCWKASIRAAMATLQQALFIWKCKLIIIDAGVMKMVVCATHTSAAIWSTFRQQGKNNKLINQSNKHF